MEALLDVAKWLSFVWVDAVVVIAVGASAVLGFRSGFIWQAVRIVSVVAAYWVAARFHPELAARLGGDMSESARMGISYVGLFVGSLLVTYLVMFLARAPINAFRPEKVDRVLGALFGAVKGVLLCGIIALGVLQYADEQGGLHHSVTWSPSAQIGVQCVRALWFGMPEE